MRRLVSVLTVVVGAGHADAGRLAFGDIEIGGGVASVTSSPNCLDGCFFPGSDARALGHAGLGGGFSISERFAIVTRMHASITDTIGAIELFAGVGGQLRLATFSTPADYLFLELVPGYEVLGVPEGGQSSGLAIATRLGVNLSPFTFALSSTLQVDAGTGHGTAQEADLTFVLGVHLGWLLD